MSDDQLSWEKMLADEVSKAEAKARNSRTSKKAAPGKKETTEVSFSKMDWSPLSKKSEPNTVPTSVLVTEETTKLKVEKTTLTSEPNAEVKVKISKSETQKAAVVPASDLAAFAPDTSGEIEVPADEEPQVLSVFELNRHIKNILEGKFPIIWLKGEISNFKAHTSGHFYFSLKDSKAQINAVMFKGFNQQVKFRPTDGMEVIVRGRVTVYEPRGNYQIFCETMEPVGAGALQKAFEQLKAKLQAEGLFAPERKRPLPALPRHIAIVTSPTGAAIRDMLNVLGRRFKGARVTLIPARVQGDGAAAEICAAIDLANRLKDVDVMIVGRGGGSIEDMWCFNEESVARAIAAARVPVISAVGHEIDFTIADFVADLRAPTPSAAAELVVKNAADLQNKVEAYVRGLKLGMHRKLELLKHKSEGYTKRLVDPQRRIQDCMLRSDELTQRLETLFMRGLSERHMRVALLKEKLGDPKQRISAEEQKIASLRQRLSTGWATYKEAKRCEVVKHMALLDSLSPLKVVTRGYSVVTLNDKVVNDVAQVEKGEVVCIQFARGRASAEIKKIENDKGVLDRE